VSTPKGQNDVAPSRYPWLKRRRATLIIAGLTLLVFVLSAPGALADAFDRGGLYLFSKAFFEDIPARLTGPGRFRFLLQPLIAIILGIRSGLADARSGRPPYLYGLFFHSTIRRELLKSGFETVINLLLMSILMDAVFQWIILGVSHPGAALVVGPVLILGPFALARALSNRLAAKRRTTEFTDDEKRIDHSRGYADSKS
jgi:hypothetical protein